MAFLSRPHRALAVTAAATLLALVPAGPAPAEKVVKRHDHGRSVKHLQRLLHIHPDGAFGAGTARALRRFQHRHGLKADGVAGPATWDMLYRSARARKAHAASVAAGGSGRVRVTSRGPSVTLLQQRLGVGADGVFGPGTARAVRTFQRAHGLTADAVVGPATWQALGVTTPEPVLKRVHHLGGSSAGSGSGLPSAIIDAIRAANRIQFRPYVYGGGHGSFRSYGYDCSGSVSYVLHGAGLLNIPKDSGQLMSYGAPGPGRYITIYANAGHAYMKVLHRRYDTSMRGIGGSRWSSTMRPSAGYVVRHPVGL